MPIDANYLKRYAAMVEKKNVDFFSYHIADDNDDGDFRNHGMMIV